MPVTNPEAIRFCNEQVRPACEKFRALKAEVDAIIATWNGGLNVILGVAEGTVEDGREAEGVSRITGNDVTGVMVQLTSFQTQLDGVGVADVISRPCVRPLSAQ